MLPSPVQSSPRPSNRRYLLLALPFAFALLLVAHRGSSNSRDGQKQRLAEYLPTVLGGYSFSSQEGMELSEEWEREEGVEQEEVEWRFEEERRLREYKWETPEVDVTLKRVLEGLDENERRTRDWLLATRPAASQGVGIGLGASSPPEPIRPGPPATPHRGLPSPDEGPGAFSGGSYEKYAELLEEWQTGRQKTSGERAKWEDEYTLLHAQIMSGEREPMLLEYACPSSKLCGGLGDRMLGITSTFLYAVLTGRALSISWEHPVPIDMLFDSPFIDWSQRFKVGSTPTRNIYTNRTLSLERLRLPETHNPSAQALDRTWPHFAKEHHEPWIVLEALNRGITLRSFRYPSVAPDLEALGFRMDSAYSSMINYLLRPKPSSLAFIHQYTSLFSLPSVFSIGIQIRTGDKYMRSAEEDSVNTVDRHSHFFQCAQQVAMTYAKPSQKIVYYLITDSAHLREDAVRAYPSSVVVSGLAQKHNELGGQEQRKAKLEEDRAKEELFNLDEVVEDADGLMNTLAETWTFSGTDFQVLTARSGYGKIPTWLRGRPGSTIRVERVMEHEGRVIHPKLDCRLDSAILSYSQLAEGWSLG